MEKLNLLQRGMVQNEILTNLYRIMNKLAITLIWFHSICPTE